MTRAKNSDLTLTQIHELFRYERETGEFFWRAKCKSVNPGDKAGSMNAYGYRQIKVSGKTYMAHRMVWFVEYGYWPEKMMDHINGERDDNRVANLREATENENCRNRRPARSKKTLLKGAAWHKRDLCWVSSICVSGKRKWLGTFKTEADAHAAYCEAAKAIFGEFARLS